MAHVPQINLYDILGLTKSATTDDVRRAYRRRALETHPDKLGPNITERQRTFAEAKFRRVHEAFEVLSDPTKREVYNLQLDGRKEPPRPSTDQLFQDRQRWALRKEEEHRARLEAIRQRQIAEKTARTKEAEDVAKLVKEITDALNESIPGWAERRQKALQMKAQRELQAKRQARAR